MSEPLETRFLIELGKQLNAYIGRPRCGLTQATTYRLDCIERNEGHIKFNLLDPQGGNCGVITIRTEDLHTFTALNWKGKVRLKK